MRRRVASWVGLGLFVLLGMTVVLSMALPAAGLRAPALAQRSDSVISPVGAPWSLLVNLGPAAAPGSLLAPINDWVNAAFTFEPGSGGFRTYRAGLPSLSNLNQIREGEAFWAFTPADRLAGDLTFWEQPAGVRDLAVALVSGFNLVPWTGEDGVLVSQAVAGLGVERAYRWDTARQAFVIWNPALPASLTTDFPLEYGEGLWLDVRGAAMVWQQ